jgi:hypothetical protein
MSTRLEQKRSKAQDFIQLHYKPVHPLHWRPWGDTLSTEFTSGVGNRQIRYMAVISETESAVDIYRLARHAKLS